MLNLERINVLRTTDLPILLKESTASTNADCRVCSDRYSGDFVILAEKQSAGRGRRGRDFYSPDHGFYYSMCVNADHKEEILYTLVCAVAAAQALETCGQKTAIKWVNDLYQNGKKVSGILCEALRDEKDFSLRKVIIGIGINVSEEPFPDELRDKAANLHGVDRELLAAALTDALQEWLSKPEEQILSEYRRRSFLLNKDVTYEINGKERHGTVIDINGKGNLVIATAEGEDVLSSGEVSLKSWDERVSAS